MDVGVVSWNVLADVYLEHDRYPDMPAKLRRPEVRWPVVAAIVLAMARDIVALQEAEVALAGALGSALGAEWDIRWCPRGSSRVDGCLTAIHRRWTVVDEIRLPYRHGSQSGHVAHLLTIDRAGFRMTVANTHLKWSPPGATAEVHRGKQQMSELLGSLERSASAAVIAGDLNDEPGGPVRQMLLDAGWAELQGAESTALIRSEPLSIDVIAVRSLSGRTDSATIGRVELTGSSVPSWTCPSDHIPVTATILGR
jgi:endonuclease/exonuclease/phosphatase family metal-dependent hydrolase